MKMSNENAVRSMLAGLAMVLTLALAPAGAPAQQPDPPPPPSGDPADASPGETDGAESGEGEGAGLPGLDELLGLPTDDRPADEEARQLFEELDPSKQELERKLTAQEAADQLESAVQQMEETAFRIEKIRDTGIVTQRMQEEILTKLDVLIRQAESASSSSSSSSSSQSQPSQMQQGEQQSAGAQQSQQGQQSGQQAGADGAGGLPPFQQNPGDQLDAARAAWGALPERVREKLIEGVNDYFSEHYRAMTEEYYKRLAEEASE